MKRAGFVSDEEGLTLGRYGECRDVSSWNDECFGRFAEVGEGPEVETSVVGSCYESRLKILEKC